MLIAWWLYFFMDRAHVPLWCFEHPLLTAVLCLLSVLALLVSIVLAVSERHVHHRALAQARTILDRVRRDTTRSRSC